MHRFERDHTLTSRLRSGNSIVLVYLCKLTVKGLVGLLYVYRSISNYSWITEVKSTIPTEGMHIKLGPKNMGEALGGSIWTTEDATVKACAPCINKPTIITELL